jgi:hypothetical protein
MNKNSAEKFALRILVCAVVIFSFQIIFFLGYEYYFELGRSYINFPDHEFYVNVVGGEGLSANLTSVNNYPISAFYLTLHDIFGLDLIFSSMVVNFLVMIFSYARLEFICFYSSGRFLPIIGCLSIAVALQFSVLINKDSFSLLFYIILVSFLIARRGSDLFWVLVLMPMRVQFLMIFLCVLFLTAGVSGKASMRVFIRLLFLYVFCSTIALYLERYGSLLSHENYAEGGVSYWISKLNSDYFIGSYLLNFLKPIQYVYDLYRGAVFDFSLVGIVVFSSRLIFFFLIIFNGIYFLRIVYAPWTYSQHKDLFFVSALVCSFFLVYMISPVVHYRYLIGISPIIILFFFLRRKAVRNSARIDPFWRLS